MNLKYAEIILFGNYKKSTFKALFFHIHLIDSIYVYKPLFIDL